MRGHFLQRPRFGLPPEHLRRPRGVRHEHCGIARASRRIPIRNVPACGRGHRRHDFPDAAAPAVAAVRRDASPTRPKVGKGGEVRGREVAATAVVLPGPPPPLASPGPRSLRPPRSGSRGWRLRVLPLMVAAGLVALAAWFSRGEGGAGTGAEAGVGPWPSDAISIAVLPFVDMSPDGSLEHWADGVAEEILNTLAGIREIRVPARTSSFHFKGRSVPVRQIAELLGVNHVLEGSVRASGDRLRFTAQLIDARDDRHLWSATFDPEDDDVFAVEAEIARTVAAALRVELGLAPAPPPSPGAEAHELYLRGLFHWHRRSAPDLLMALRHFEEATRLEPSYARPWAGLALVYAVVPINFVPTLPIPEARVRLETVARPALELDPSLAEVHAALGLGYHFDWRWEDAEREFLRALELNPRLATARQWYAEHLAKTGRGALALEQVERALELDPLSLVIRSDIGLIHFINGDFAPARAQWERVLADDPAFILPHFFLHRLDLLDRVAMNQTPELPALIGDDPALAAIMEPIVAGRRNFTDRPISRLEG